MFTVKITPNEKGIPVGKLADIELHFAETTCPACEGHGVLSVAESGSLAVAEGICAACEGQGSVAGSDPLAGLKLIGFSIWERRSGSGRNVTFPARQYSVNGERRSFALLRPMTDPAAQDRLRDAILTAYEQFEAANDGEAVRR